MRKLFFFDIDGTLTSAKEFGKIYDSTRAAIAQLQDNGHFLALATGRALFRAKAFQQEIGIKNMVCEGGNCIILNNEQISYEAPDQALLKTIYEEAISKQVGIALSCEDSLHRITPNSLFHEYAGDCHEFMEVHVDTDFRIEKAEQIRRLFIADPMKKMDMEKLTQIGIMHYGEDQFIIIEPDDKYRGIRKVCEFLGEDESQVVVFGDGMNDRKMFKAAPFAIAMGNAVKEVKAEADYITADSDHDGIFLACKHFGWI